MYTRELPDLTLQDFIDKMAGDTGSIVNALTNEVTVALTSGIPTFAFGQGDARLEVPATPGAIEAFATFVGIPIPFLNRLPSRLQQVLLADLLEAAAAPVNVYVNGTTITDIISSTASRIGPKRLLEAVAKAIDPTAIVVDGWVSQRELRLDVIAPEGFDRGIGGDPEVDDITRGGVRMGYDRQRNLAPWVNPYVMRLVCTNGMEVEVPHELDSRNKATDDVVGEFERLVAMAFGDVESIIESFYDLRSQKVDNVERTLLRIGWEQKISGRVLGRLVEEAAAIDTDTPTMFEVVNHITNLANEPVLCKRDGSRRLLQRAGGAMVTEHSARCGRCQTRL